MDEPVAEIVPHSPSQSESPCFQRRTAQGDFVINSGETERLPFAAVSGPTARTHVRLLVGLSAVLDYARMLRKGRSLLQLRPGISSPVKRSTLGTLLHARGRCHDDHNDPAKGIDDRDPGHHSYIGPRFLASIERSRAFCGRTRFLRIGARGD